LKYRNLDDADTLKSFKDLRRWQKERRAKAKDLSFTVPHSDVKEVRFLQNNRTVNTITWIGHSTFLIQFRGLNILTDPVWGNRMGFFKRLSAPGLSLNELPEPDIVLISHSHYDHLHFSTLRRLPGSPLYLVPSGLRRKMRMKGYRRVQELAWWEKTDVQGVEFHFVPAQHWSRRTLWDTNRSHWGGWVIQSGLKDGQSGLEDGQSGLKDGQDAPVERKREKAVYFAGDSGYFRGFREIGVRFDIGCALLPIGAYEPEWFMAGQHVSPEEAVQAFLDCRGETFVPMHYGAFRLADDTPKEALDRLEAEWTRRGLDRERLRMLRLGETMRI